jgi:hypothetical protein
MDVDIGYVLDTAMSSNNFTYMGGETAVKQSYFTAHSSDNLYLVLR